MTGARRKRIVEMSALAVVVVGLSVYGAFAVVRHYDLANPYRDGTTHTVTLSNGGTVINGLPECSNAWYIKVGDYTWQAEGVPRSWGAAPVRGKLHIIDSQNPVASFSKAGPEATFTARGITLDMSGGKVEYHWGFAADCEGYPGGYAAGTS